MWLGHIEESLAVGSRVVMASVPMLQILITMSTRAEEPLNIQGHETETTQVWLGSEFPLFMQAHSPLNFCAKHG